MRFFFTSIHAAWLLLLTSCGSTYPTKSYGRAFVTEAYKQGFYDRSNYDWEMERIARMKIPDGPPVNKVTIRGAVQSTFRGLPRTTTPSKSSDPSQPQMVYVQNPQYHPGGGEYTPQPQQVYVQTPQRQPGGGEYTPQPQQMYVQTPQRQPGGGEYTPQPQQRYVQYEQPKPKVDTYTSSQPPKYVPNKKPGFLLPPGQIQANPWDTGKQKIDEYEAKKAQQPVVVQKIRNFAEDVFAPGPSELFKAPGAAANAISSSWRKEAVSGGADYLVDKKVGETRESQTQSTSSKAQKSSPASGKSWWQFWKK